MRIMLSQVLLGAAILAMVSAQGKSTRGVRGVQASQNERGLAMELDPDMIADLVVKEEEKGKGKGYDEPDEPVARNPVSLGDPHFTQFNGNKFDFHGGCDLVLLDHPKFNQGQGLKIHIRTKIETWWSYIESAVVQIGDDTLEVKSGIENKEYWVNGKAGDKVVDSGAMPFTIGGFFVRFRVRRANEFQFKIKLYDEQFILVRSVKDFLRVEIGNPESDGFGGSNGLMGHFDSGKMLARDGATVIEDPVEYGKEWQVQSSEPMLFHAVEGVQHPQTCAMPSEDQTARRQLREGNMTRDQAMKACRYANELDLEDCISDVLATNDVEMAGAF